MKSHSESGLLTVDQCSLPDNSFWDIADLSRYLKVKIKTLYAMMPDIPHYRVGKLVRFKKQEIDTWMENKRGKALDGPNKARKMRGKQVNKGNFQIGEIIRKAIDQTKDEGYNPAYGKSDRIEGPKKEIKNGSI